MKRDTPDDSTLLSALASVVPEGMVTSYIVVATYVDEDGDERIWSEAAPDQRCHQTMGLLSWGMAVENRHVGDMWAEDDDE